MNPLKTYAAAAAIAAVLAVFGPWLDSQPTDTQAQADTEAAVADAAALHDAISAAIAAHPQDWTPEQIARARAAVAIAVQGDVPTPAPAQMVSQNNRQR